MYMYYSLQEAASTDPKLIAINLQGSSSPFPSTPKANAYRLVVFGSISNPFDNLKWFVVSSFSFLKQTPRSCENLLNCK